jgi:pyruvate dehydrogenase (quinone)
MEGNPKFEASQDIPDVDYAAFAEQVGLRGIRVERPEDVGSAWEQALAADRPVVLDALCDPSVPPLPPHITLEQAKAFASALVKRDPNAMDMAVQSVKQKLDEFVGRHSS